MIKPLPIEALLSYGLLGAGALIIFGILSSSCHLLLNKLRNWLKVIQLQKNQMLKRKNQIQWLIQSNQIFWRLQALIDGKTDYKKYGQWTETKQTC